MNNQQKVFTFKASSPLTQFTHTDMSFLSSQGCSGCHIAIDFRWFWIISFQCRPSFPPMLEPITQQPTNSPWPIKSLSITWHSKMTFGKSSAGTLNERASFQTGLCVPFLTDVFFRLTFLPSITSVIRT